MTKPALKLWMKTFIGCALIGVIIPSSLYAANANSNFSPPAATNPLSNQSYYKHVIAAPNTTIASMSDWQGYQSRAQQGDVIAFQMGDSFSWNDVKNIINQSTSGSAIPGMVILNTNTANAFNLSARDAAPWLTAGAMVGIGQNVGLEDSDAWTVVGSNDAPVVLTNQAAPAAFMVAGKNLRNGIYEFANNNQTQAYLTGLNQWSGNGKPSALFLGNGTALTNVAAGLKPKELSGLGYVINSASTTSTQAQQLGTTVSSSTDTFAVDAAGDLLATALVAGLTAGMISAAYAPAEYVSYGWGGYPVQENMVNVYSYNRAGQPYTFATDGAVSTNLLNSGALKNATLALHPANGSWNGDLNGYTNALRSGKLGGMVVSGNQDTLNNFSEAAKAGNVPFNAGKGYVAMAPNSNALRSVQNNAHVAGNGINQMMNTAKTPRTAPINNASQVAPRTNSARSAAKAPATATRRAAATKPAATASRSTARRAQSPRVKNGMRAQNRQGARRQGGAQARRRR